MTFLVCGEELGRRLIVDSNKDSVKAVLLYNGNENTSIPIAHQVNTKESYETMVKLLKCMKTTTRKFVTIWHGEHITWKLNTQHIVVCYASRRVALENIIRRGSRADKKCPIVSKDGTKYVPQIKKKATFFRHYTLNLDCSTTITLNKKVKSLLIWDFYLKVFLLRKSMKDFLSKMLSDKIYSAFNDFLFICPAVFPN